MGEWPFHSDVLLIKTDASGDTLWTRWFDRRDNEGGSSVQQTSDGGYIIAAGWLLKTDASGDTLWTKTIGVSGHDGSNSVQQTSDGGYVVAGDYGDNVLLFKTAPDPTNVKKVKATLVSDYRLSQNYPNPFNPTTAIEFSIPKSEFVTLKIYNLLGQEVEELVSDKLNAGNYTYDWDAGFLASGIYIYKMQAGAFQQVRKMVYLK